MARIFFGVIFVLLGAYANYPEWLRYGVKVIAEFHTSNQSVRQYKEGYGIIISDGLILTSASIVYAGIRAKDITLYHSETLGEPIACLSHAKILAIDDTLDLAVLQAQNFTDIYCNILPEPNFRELHFKEMFFNFPISVFTSPIVESLEVSYFKEHDWSQFFREKIVLEDLLQLSLGEKERLHGMPLFIGDAFFGLKRKESQGDFGGLSFQENVQHAILTYREILGFLCQLEKETSVLKNRHNLKDICSAYLPLTP